MHVRREIYEVAQLRMNSYLDIIIDTEKGPLYIRDYIPIIIEESFYGGEFEISIAAYI